MDREGHSRAGARSPIRYFRPAVTSTSMALSGEPALLYAMGRPSALRQNRKSYGQWPGFPLIFINSDDIREIGDHMADDDRRPKTIPCAHCGRKFKIEPFGRVPTYCSAS